MVNRRLKAVGDTAFTDYIQSYIPDRILKLNLIFNAYITYEKI